MAHVDCGSVQFDVEDDVPYFDHTRVSARGGPRLQSSPVWTLEAGPRLEWMRAPLAQDEAYDEYAGYASFETIARGALWTIAPAAGRRTYRATGVDPAFGSLSTGHSSYDFLELDAFGDQAVPGGLRLRLSANGRWEFHDAAVENAASLYFSLDVRRLF